MAGWQGAPKNVFESVAAAVADVKLDLPSSEDECVRGEFALALADALVATNERFDPLRFLDSCGVRIPLSIAQHYSTRLRLRIESLDRRAS